MSPGGRLDFCYWRSKGEGLRIYIYIYIDNIYIYIYRRVSRNLLGGGGKI